MGIRDHPAVKSWVARLEKLGVVVPTELNQTVMKQLLCSTEGNSLQQHAAVHLAFHVHAAELCAASQKAGGNDDISHQATQ